MNTKNNNNIDISIIIPQKNSLCTIPRLFASIPDTNRVEIILVDNSDVPVKKEDIKVSRAVSYTHLTLPTKGRV